jgi:hypothetical protein
MEQVSSIGTATQEYASTYGSAHVNTAVSEPPRASTDKCIIMPFVEGLTLGEYTAAVDHLDYGARIREAREVCTSLTHGLHLLAGERPLVDAEPQRQHLDLSPNNIILRPDRENVAFIDLGQNHLYSRQVGIAEHDDSIFVAPEVKNRKPNTDAADLYSLGIILLRILAAAPPRDGRTPSTVWQASPELGRVLDDLIEERPERRLLFLGAGPWTYKDIGAHLDAAFERSLKEPAASDSRVQKLIALLAPASREPWTHWKQWRHNRRSGDGYLLFFTFAASLVWWFIATRTAVWQLDDVLTFQSDPLPSPDLLAAKAIAFSQGLVAAKYYQTILARLRVSRLGGRLALLTEASMRLTVVVALPTTLIAVMWKPHLWAWTCAAGATLVALTNLLTALLASRILKVANSEGRGGERLLSTAPPGSAVSARGYEQWWWTMLLYAAVIAAIAFGLQTDRLQDTYAYASGLLLITFGIHYVAKLVVAGIGIRGELADAYAVGERLNLLRQRTAGPGEPLLASQPAPAE